MNGDEILSRLVAKYNVGDWLATLDGEVVGHGETLEAAMQAADEAGYSAEDYVLEVVAPKNLLFLGEARS